MVVAKFRVSFVCAQGVFRGIAIFTSESNTGSPHRVHYDWIRESHRYSKYDSDPYAGC